MTVIEGLCSLVTGRLAQARGLVDAWTWNARRMVGLHRRARRVAPGEDGGRPGAAPIEGPRRGAAHRAVPRDRAPRRRVAPSDGDRHAGGAGRAGVQRAQPGHRSDAGGGRVRPLPLDPVAAIREWAGGWRTAGLGSSSPAPTAFGLLGVLGVVLFGAMGALRQLLFLGMLPLGAYGAWRLARPIGSRRAQWRPWSSTSPSPCPTTRWPEARGAGWCCYAGAPWMIQSLALASRLAPFGPRSSTEEAQAAGSGRPLGRQMLGLGLIVALVGAVVPFAVVVMLACAAALIVGSLVCFRFGGVTRLLVAAIGAAAVAVLLHLPWSLDLIVTATGWRSPEREPPSAARSRSGDCCGSRPAHSARRPSVGDSWSRQGCPC